MQYVEENRVRFGINRRLARMILNIKSWSIEAPVLRSRVDQWTVWQDNLLCRLGSEVEG